MNITNDKLMEILERNLGLPMGDSGIFYIEDPGQKRINKIYFSKTNMLLYKCTADNNDTTITGNFKLYSLTNTDDYVGALTGIGRGQVKYIQDVGTKYVNNVYIDRPTGKLYRCVTETSSVNNDSNFKENNLENTVSRLGLCEKRTHIMVETTGGTTASGLAKAKMHITRYGNICFMRIDTYSTSFSRGEEMFKIPTGFVPVHNGGCDGGFAVISESYQTVGTCRLHIASGTISARSELPPGQLGTACWITNDA